MYGWGGRIRTYGTRDQNPMPYHLATPQLIIELHYLNYIFKCFRGSYSVHVIIFFLPIPNKVISTILRYTRSKPDALPLGYTPIDY